LFIRSNKNAVTNIEKKKKKQKRVVLEATPSSFKRKFSFFKQTWKKILINHYFIKRYLFDFLNTTPVFNESIITRKFYFSTFKCVTNTSFWGNIFFYKARNYSKEDKVVLILVHIFSAYKF